MRRLTAARRTSRDPAVFRFGDRTLAPDEVVTRLRPFLTDDRILRIEAVLAQRTLNLAVVLEGMVDTGNVAAVMRTADGFGVQSFHTIDTAASYKHSKRTSRGAEKWLDRYRWRSPAECVASLHAAGQRVLAAHPSEESVPLDDIDFAQPTALVFGNEMSGLSDELLAVADGTTAIPTDGFTQSYNISVAAGVCLAQARRNRIARLGAHGDLPDDAQARLRALWYLRTVPSSRGIMDRLLADEAAADARSSLT